LGRAQARFFVAHSEVHLITIGMIQEVAKKKGNELRENTEKETKRIFLSRE
jgi:hypothetical protein